MSVTHELSQAAHDRLSAELQHLRTIGRIEIADRIERARELGDLRENGDYHAAKDEQGKMEARIGQLGGILENCVIIDHGTETDTIRTGVIVSLTYEGDDEIEQYLYGSIEERREGFDNLSPTSPLGEALNGAKVGDTVTFKAPNGADLSVRVIDIEV